MCDQFKRLIGLSERAFYKLIGNGMLTFKDSEYLVLDVKVTLNDRALSYLEDDINAKFSNTKSVYK